MCGFSPVLHFRLAISRDYSGDPTGDHIRSGFCQSVTIRSDPGFVNAREQHLQTGLVNLFHLFIFLLKDRVHNLSTIKASEINNLLITY